MAEKIQRDPETEQFIDTLEHKELYRYMRDAYDEVTELGENYDPETHDEVVAERASQKYDVTAEQAMDIYTSVEMKIGDFHAKRMNKTK
ncbi:hypothetical protein [Rossellomorea marisflavi]|uniref:hypothetical protein n=1 Tax=Rossellomorea marisflavi TaxID=189381 RepID=UPI00345C9836